VLALFERFGGPLDESPGLAGGRVASAAVDLPSVQLRRVFPDQARVDAADSISGLRLAELAPPERPYLVLDMVASADGKATVEGRTRALGNEADRVVFHHLRTQADALLVGAGTLRIERYGRLIKWPELRAKREREGLSPDPTAIVASARLDLAPDLPLLADPDARVVLLTSSELELQGVAAHVQYLRAPTEALEPHTDPGGAPRFRLRPMLERLRSEHGVRSVLCEGGPTLNADLLAEGLVDELFLCVAPLLAGGGEAPTIVAGGPLPEPAAMELVWAYESESHLLLRYRVRS
jgi:riboflavin-specific deaminase-like protein